MKLYTILSLFFAFGLSSPMYSCNEKYEDYILKIAKRDLLIEGGIVFKLQRGAMAIFVGGTCLVLLGRFTFKISSSGT